LTAVSNSNWTRYGKKPSCHGVVWLVVVVVVVVAGGGGGGGATPLAVAVVRQITSAKWMTRSMVALVSGGW
jgi:hypothetical protein